MSIATNPNTNLEPSPPPQSHRGDWTWELITMFPRQGEWTEEQYLRYEFDGLVEFLDGVLEFLPMPKFSHQDLVAYLFERLNTFIGPRSPREVYFAPVWVRTVGKSIREPDVAYIRPSRIPDRKKPSDGADLVMEVVSGSAKDRNRDYKEKREEYAAAGIPEYWIVDPETKTVTVLKLVDSKYTVHGEYKSGSIAISAVLPGFEVNVSDAFAAATIE